MHDQSSRTSSLHQSPWNGFTLIELLIVIALVAILSMVGFSIFIGQTDLARDSKRINDLSSLQGALEMYRASKQKYPLPVKFNSNEVYATETLSTDLCVGNKTVLPFAITMTSNEVTKFETSNDTTDKASLRCGTALIGQIDENNMPAEFLSQTPKDPYITELKNAGIDSIKADRYLYAVDCGAGWSGDVTTCNPQSYQLLTVLHNKKDFKLKVIGNSSTPLFGEFADNNKVKNDYILKDGQNVYKGVPNRLDPIEK